MLGSLSVAGGACDRTESRATDSVSTTSTIQGSPAESATCGDDVRRIATQLGGRMRLVSLLAPDSIVKRALADAYGSLVSQPLLDAWQTNPRSAPGREVSNPWPARIDVRSIARDGADCRVEGDVVYVTGTDTTRAVERRAVSLRVQSGRQPLVDTFRWTETPATPAAPTRASGDAVSHIRDAAEVVRQYYQDIQNHDFDAAYARWGDSGRASGKTRDAFAVGFANTASVVATVSDSGSIEGAAGSQFVTVPVRVDATLRNGTPQHFAGTYTLRRVMVDGATPEQKRWHIFKAELRESRQ